MTHNPRAVTDIDAAIGSRIRTRRLELKLSQEKMAEGLGVTFQQVQKYERGSNRVPASRLPEIAGILGVSIQYFFEDFEATSAPNGDGGVIAEQLTRATVIRLIKAAQGCGDRVVAAACAMLEAVRKETADVG